MVLKGDLSPGDRLEEVALSQKMGVSRTPLREALIALEEDGIVASVPNKGFVVAPANVELVRETYPILAALECAAIRLSGDRLSTAVADLAKLNDRLAGETRKRRQHALDAAFHERLVRDCGNARLLKLISQHWAHAQRFDGAHDRGTADRDGSCREHAQIIGALRRGRIDDACEILAAHWERGQKVVIQWLQNR
jgi:DNA-binding GntR family transcriptional regulator